MTDSYVWGFTNHDADITACSLVPVKPSSEFDGTYNRKS